MFQSWKFLFAFGFSLEPRFYAVGQASKVDRSRRSPTRRQHQVPLLLTTRKVCFADRAWITRLFVQKTVSRQTGPSHAREFGHSCWRVQAHLRQPLAKELQRPSVRSNSPVLVP